MKSIRGVEQKQRNAAKCGTKWHALQEGRERAGRWGWPTFFLTTMGFKEGDDCFLHIDVQAILQPSPREAELVKVSYTFI